MVSKSIEQNCNTMTRNLRKNKKNVFNTSITVIILTMTIGLFFITKPSLLLFFNDNRSPFWDVFFKYGTKLGEEPAYLILTVVFLFRKVKKGMLIGLIGFFVMGLSFALKALFKIDRPLTYFRKLDLTDQLSFIEGVDLHTAATSFPSGHAMSAFALFSLVALFLSNKKRYVIPVLFVAVIIAISRVYLMQHFYIDIYVGSVIGVLVALLFYEIEKRIKWGNDHFLENPILRKKHK